MANAETLQEEEPVRTLIVGYPGSAKTGGLAPLANAGFKLRILDFDGNYKSLLQYTHKDKLKNIDIVTLEDKLRHNGRFMEPVGQPHAFTDALALMDHWKYPNADGTITDLGHSKDWTDDTIVVLDGITSMGDASMNRARSVLNKTPLNQTQQLWGFAQTEQMNFLKKLTSTHNRHHVIVLSHLVMIGPKDIEKDDSDMTKELKEKMANLIPTRLYPSALGKALPPLVAAEFPTVLLFETDYPGGKPTRRIKTQPRQELDLKLPALDVADKLPIEDGMLQIFKALAPASVKRVQARSE